MSNQKIFPISRYDEIVAQTMQNVVELGVKKGGEYAGDVDRLANFRRNAEQWGLANMEQCWGVYAGKHWDAITQYIRDLSSGVKRDRLESLEGRVDDVITYCLLFKAMLAERADEIQIGRDFGAPKGMPHASDAEA
jgi:hypothetical protein